MMLLRDPIHFFFFKTRCWHKYPKFLQWLAIFQIKNDNRVPRHDIIVLRPAQTKHDGFMMGYSRTSWRDTSWRHTSWLHTLWGHTSWRMMSQRMTYIKEDRLHCFYVSSAYCICLCRCSGGECWPFQSSVCAHQLLLYTHLLRGRLSFSWWRHNRVNLVDKGWRHRWSVIALCA